MSEQNFSLNDILEDVDTGQQWVVQHSLITGYPYLLSLLKSGRLGSREKNLIPKYFSLYRKIGRWSETSVEFTQ